MTPVESLVTVAVGLFVLGCFVGWLLHCLAVELSRSRGGMLPDETFQGFRTGRDGRQITSIRELVEDDQ